ncbi:MAG: PEGA domain-containing protein [Myxococcota bacterium]
MTRPDLKWALVLLALSSTASCQLLDKLRGVFHGGTKPPGPEGDSSLSLKVDPDTGIEIRLDGTLVSRRSPYEIDTLAAGEHQLVIRADGYHPFATPVTLGEQDSVSLTINLRERPVKAKPKEPKRPGPPPKPPEGPGPPLPSGVDPITLKLATQPKHPVRVNGHDVVGKSVVLKRVSGRVLTGPIELKYRIGSSGLLEFTLPDDNAQWFRDGEALSTRTFPLHQGSIRLERRDPDGKLQVMWLRR